MGKEAPLVIAAAFKCHDCTMTFRLERPEDDPTTSTGSCPGCGGKNWSLYTKWDDGRITQI